MAVIQSSTPVTVDRWGIKKAILEALDAGEIESGEHDARLPDDWPRMQRDVAGWADAIMTELGAAAKFDTVVKTPAEIRTAVADLIADGTLPTPPDRFTDDTETVNQADVFADGVRERVKMAHERVVSEETDAQSQSGAFAL